MANVAQAPGQLAFWWLGQAGFLVAGGRTSLLLDPFLAPHPERLKPSPLDANGATGIGAILYTHEHFDHLDLESLPALAAASPNAQIIVPRPLVSLLAEAGIDPARILGAQPDEAIHLGDAVVHPVPARHGVEVEDAYSFGEAISGGLVRFLGYVVELNGVRFYHAGDTIRYDGQAERLRALAVDILLLPINGRDEFRERHKGIVGNLDDRDAAQLAVDAGADLLIPMHYEMFASNLGNPAELVAIIRNHHPSLNVLFPGTVRPFVYTRVHEERSRMVS
jgi:L-ascorbate metabolism protein UlaG (beta-lactamase superfamily)